MTATWEEVEAELARMGSAPQRPTETERDPALIDEVRRKARLAREIGIPPPDRVLPDLCGTGPVMIWRGLAIGAAV